MAHDPNKTAPQSETSASRRTSASDERPSSPTESFGTSPAPEGFFRTLFQKAAEGIMVVDPMTRRVVQVNPALAEMYGYAEDRMQGMDITRLHPESAWPTVAGWFESHMQDFGREELEARCVRSDGREFVARLRVSLVEMGGQPYVVSFFIDVTRRRRAEELVRIQRDLAQTLNALTDLDAALKTCLSIVIAASNMDSGGVYLVDQATGSIDLACSEGLDPEFVRQVSHYEADSANARVVLHGDALYHSYVKLKQNMGTAAIDRTLKATAVVPVKHDGRVIACLNLASHTCEDVPDMARDAIEMIAESIGSAIVRLRAEQAVRESENRFRELTAHINDVFWIVTPSWDRFLYVSPAYERIWGRTCESLYEAPTSFLKTIHEEDRDRIRARITESKLGGPARHTSEEYRIIRPDGTIHWVRSRAYPVCDRSGRTVRIIGVSSDVTEQRLAEHVLRVSEAQYREIFDSMHEGIALMDENGVTTFANPAYAAILGEPGIGRIVGRNLREYFSSSAEADDLLAAVCRPADHREADRTSRHELQIVTAKGERKTVLFMATPRFDEKRRFIGTIGLVLDITQMKQAESALMQSETRFRDLTELLPQVVFELDADGYITYSNRFGFDSLGYAQQNLEAGLHFLAVVAPEDRERAMDEFRGALSGVSGLGREYLLVRKDGSVFPALIYQSPVVRDGRIVGSRGVVLDITDRKKTELALRESEERWHFALESSGDGMWDWNVQTNQVFFSRQWKMTLGYDERDIGNCLDEWSSRVHPDDLEGVYAEIKRHFAGETPIYTSEHRLRCKDGGYKWILDRGKVLSRTRDGKPLRMIGTHTDITERKQAEVALRESQRRLEELIGFLPEATVAIDRQGRVIVWNRAIEEMTGVKAGDMLGKGDYEYALPFYGQRRPILIDLALQSREEIRKRYVFVETQGDVLLAEAEVPLRGGELHVLWAKASPLYDAQGNIIGAIESIRDVTGQRRAETALREREAKLGSIMAAAPIGIGIVSNRILQHVNKTFCEMVGYSEEELVDRSAAMLYCTGEEFDRVGREYARMTDQGVSSIETVWRRKDGRTIEVILNITPLDKSDWSKGITFTALDITDRKRVERALMERESRLASVLKVAPIGIGLVINRTFTQVNESLCAMVGYSEEDILGRSARMLYPTEEDWEYVGREKYDQIRKYGSGTVQTKWVKKDGSVIDVLLSSTPLDRDDWSKGVTFTALDITERMRAERDLQAAEEQYRVLFEWAGEGIMVATGEGFALANPAFCALTGYSQEELLQLRIEDFIHPDHRDMVMERYRQRREGRSVPTGYDFKIMTKSGETKWVRINSTVITWRGQRATLNFVEDITVSRNAQEEIRKFKTISDSATYGTAITDMSGTLLYVNEAFAQMHGYRCEELLGQNLAVLHSDEQQPIVRRINEGLIESGSFTSTEVWHRRRGGTVFPTLMNGVVIRDATGQPQFLAATAADITELKRLQEFADRAQRLEAAGRIAGQVAHDFNNLLGPLVAYPEFIREEIGATHPANAYLDTMESAAQQMADINQQLLSLGRRGHYNLEPLNLNEVVRQVLQQLAVQTERLEVVTALSGDLMNVKAGSAQIVRVFTNLISNAVDAMQGAGTLTITTENWYADHPRGAYGQIERGEYIKVTVADTGCGIPGAILGQVFEPFFTTKKTDKKRGSGLGLSVVHAIVEDHGGYVDIESTEGVGTSVYLYFPITREEQNTARDHQIVGGTESILLVDDDRVQQEVTTRLLEKLGYQVAVVKSGEEAIQFVRRHAVDLVILDMIMPGGMDGVDTYRGILEYCPAQKAVIVSGFAEGDRVAQAQALGAGEFLRKPLTFKSLAHTVRRELDRVLDIQPV